MLVQPLPKLYAIIDRATLEAHGVSVADFAATLASASVSLLQYRDKSGSPQQVLAAAAEIKAAFAGHDCLLVMNDRADLAALAGWPAVHVGQGDLSVSDAQRVLSSNIGEQGIIGLSTHTDEQIIAADASGADYIAIGPVFSTATKPDAEKTIGLEGVRRARALTSKPLVAIGGITRDDARSVLDAGADSVAVISGLFAPGQTLAASVEDFLVRLR
jgi:thiamine-phosphate pyrophosphorylase